MERLLYQERNVNFTGKIRNAYKILVGSQLRKIQLEGRLY
jgi:hypothetical protein